jgi:hypothetical protein
MCGCIVRGLQAEWKYYQNEKNLLILEDFNFKNQQQEENLHEERKRPKRF